MSIMKTIATIVESANIVVKESSKTRKAFNASYYSLSRLLKDMQAKSMRKVAEPLFNALGIDFPETKEDMLAPADIFSMLAPEQVFIDKNGKKFPLIWSRVQAKDEDGNKLWEDEKETVPVLEDKATKITEASWTMNKLFRLIAQANAFKA